MVWWLMSEQAIMKRSLVNTSAGVALLAAAQAAENWADRLLVVANRRIPDSVALAQYYAERRGIATNRIFLVDAPQQMEITRRDFNETLRDPIDRHLQTRGWLVRDPQGAVVRNDCWLLVLCYGVPLKIAADPELREPEADKMRPQMRRNEAAVDSELARLPSLASPVTGPLPNPFHRMEFFPPYTRLMMLVGRVDGPTAGVARALVDRALAVETTGLMGRAYFDARGAQEPHLKETDDSLRGACKAALRAGIESVIDERETVFPADYPMSDVALYAGWYSEAMAGALGRPTFRFRPGAIAYHIHSFSATFLNANWVGPCLARGAGAGIGFVYEPYLNFVADPKTFVEKLLQGCNFVESAYAATPVLSWQQTCVGDPLYRPFPFPAEEQIEQIEAANHPDKAWGCVRRANLLAAAGKEPEAIGYLTRQNASLRSPILSEKLGDLYRRFRLKREAIAAYQAALAGYSNPYAFVRVSQHLMDLLFEEKRHRDALTVLDAVVRKFPSYEGYGALLKQAIELAGRVGDGDKLDFYSKLISQPPR
jgi:uncharacterized protein (TIGR03790 family)